MMVKRAIGNLIRVLHFVLVLLIFLSAIWMLTFGMILSGLFLLVVTIVLSPLQTRFVRGHLARPILLLVLILAGAAFWHIPFHEYQTRMNRLRDLIKTEGAEGFSFRDKAGVYGMNLAMGVGGYCLGFEEVARETLLMAFPGPSIRTWKSDFAMASPKVRREVNRMMDELADLPAGTTTREFRHCRIAWSGYNNASEPVKVALALNSPLYLRGKATRQEGRWSLDLVAQAACRYPRSHNLVVTDNLRGKPLSLEEGIFWVLQERGWMHPFTAEWEWSVVEGDPRFDELDLPEFTLRERFFRRLVLLVVKGR